MTEPPRPRAVRHRLAIRTQLLLLLLTLAVPFLAYFVVDAMRQAAVERDHASQQMLSIARLSAARFDNHISDIQATLTLLGQVATLTSVDAEHNRAHLTAARSVLPSDVLNVVLWSADGRMVASLVPRVETALPNASQRRFFKDAMATGALAVEAPVPSLADESGEPVAVFAVPISHDGRITGVAAASVRLRSMDSLLAPDRTLPAGAVITVSNPDGVVVARSIDPGVWIGRTLRNGSSGISQALAQREGSGSFASADGVERLAGFTTATRVPWLVYVGIPTSIALAPVERALYSRLVFGSVVLLVGLILAMRVAERIASPLRRLGTDATMLQDGDLAHRSQVGPGGEVGQLATTLNRMADTIQERTASVAMREQQLRQITDNLPALIAYIDRDRRFRFANRVYTDWLGIEVGQVVGRSVAELYGDEAYEEMRPHIDIAMTGRRVVYERDQRSLGITRRVESTNIPNIGPDGVVEGLFVLVQDVTARRRLEEQRVRTEERLSLAVEASGLALFDGDLVNGRIYQSAQAAAMRGEAPVEVVDTPQSLIERVHPDDRAGLETSVRETISGVRPDCIAEFRVRHRGGEWIWVRARGRVVERDASGKALRLAGTCADITQLKRAETRLRHMAEFDALTGLPNRTLFLDRLRQAMVRTSRSGSPMALLYLDIDRFKSVNDTLGHETGDQLLRAFALSLKDSLRLSDTAARLAGDEFTVILETVGGMQDAVKVAQKLVERARLPVVIGERTVSMSTSVGVAIYTGGAIDEAELLRRADAALYEAKRRGRDGYALADQSGFVPTS